MTKYLYLFLIPFFLGCQQKVTFEKNNKATILSTEEAPNSPPQITIKNTEKEGEKINNTELSSFLGRTSGVLITRTGHKDCRYYGTLSPQ